MQKFKPMSLIAIKRLSHNSKILFKVSDKNNWKSYRYLTWPTLIHYDSQFFMRLLKYDGRIEAVSNKDDLILFKLHIDGDTYGISYSVKKMPSILAMQIKFQL